VQSIRDFNQLSHDLGIAKRQRAAQRKRAFSAAETKRDQAARGKQALRDRVARYKGQGLNRTEVASMLVHGKPDVRDAATEAMRKRIGSL
jgi:hypothetical protein